MIKKLILPVLALLAITSCSSDELLQESPNGGEPLMHFNGLMSNMTRAEVTTTTFNEEGLFFNVSAYGNGNYYFEETAAKRDGSFYPANDYYWPGYDLDFVAWYDGHTRDQFSPVEKIRNKNFAYRYSVGKTNMTKDDPLDFVYATIENKKHSSSYTEAEPLEFNHIFSQILVCAKKNTTGSDACDYNVKVNGTSLRYIPATGDFTFGYIDDTNPTTVKTNWTINNRSEITSYVLNGKDLDDGNVSTIAYTKYNKTLTSAINLTGENQILVGTAGDGNVIKEGFYLIPQKFGETFTETVSQAWDGYVNTATEKHYGAYLALNVELSKDNGGVFYSGNIAIPVFAKSDDLKDLKAGNRYIINLVFTKNGAGQIPPEDEEEGGKPVLGEPIHFTVTCADWQPTDTHEGTLVNGANGNISYE